MQEKETNFIIWIWVKITEHPLNTWAGFKRAIPLGIILTIVLNGIFFEYLSIPLGLSLSVSRIIFFSSFF